MALVEERSPLELTTGAATVTKPLGVFSRPTATHGWKSWFTTVDHKKIGIMYGAASFFFLLGAEFVGLALVFIYIGAVAVLIVFTILLTRRDSKEHYGFNWSGVLIALAVFAGLTWAVLKTQSLSIVPPHSRALTVKQIGQALMTGYVWPLQCVGLLLTAALIGALVLVMEEKK